jgi:hypothetical protein
LLRSVDHPQLTAAIKFTAQRRGQLLFQADIAAAIDKGLDINGLSILRQQRRLPDPLVTAAAQRDQGDASQQEPQIKPLPNQ